MSWIKLRDQLRNDERYRDVSETFGNQSPIASLWLMNLNMESLRRMFNETSLAERIKVKQLHYYIKTFLADEISRMNIPTRYIVSLLKVLSSQQLLYGG